MVRRRATRAGVVEKIGNYSFRGTGITTYLENDGTLELAQEMANLASPRTTNHHPVIKCAPHFDETIQIRLIDGS